MVTQKQISLKLDEDLLRSLDREVLSGYRKRNTLINEAVRLYLDYRKAHRVITSSRNDDAIQDFRLFVGEWFPIFCQKWIL